MYFGLFTTLDVWKNVVADETNYKTSYSCRQCVVYSFTPFNFFNTPLASNLESNKQIMKWYKMQLKILSCAKYYLLNLKSLSLINLLQLLYLQVKTFK